MSHIINYKYRNEILINDYKNEIINKINNTKSLPDLIDFLNNIKDVQKKNKQVLYKKLSIIFILLLL